MLNKKKAIIKFFALTALVSILSGFFPEGIAAAGTSRISLKPGKDNRLKISALELPVPQSDRDRSYLGLGGSGTFKLDQIRTRILIVEVLNSYCPHCQHEAPRVNELYRNIQERADLKDQIKMIGIGIGDSSDELDSFKEEYQVSFPLIPDQNGDSGETLGVKGTPTFIGIRLNDQGLPEIFFFQEGGFKKAPRFLNEIIKRSRLK